MWNRAAQDTISGTGPATSREQIHLLGLDVELKGTKGAHGWDVVKEWKT